MPKVCAIRGRASHQTRWGSAFGDGIKRHGFEVVDANKNDIPRCDVFVVWGTRNRHMINAAKNQGAQVVILERGYLGDRFEWTSVSLGGELNNRAQFGPCMDNGQRFRSIAQLEEWQTPTNRALIIGQVETDMSVQRMKVRDIYKDAAEVLRGQGFEVFYRPHPLGRLAIPELATTSPNVPIHEALNGMGLAFTINSNGGVDALLAGVPTVAIDRGSMAWGVAAKQIEVQRNPREEWAAHLAWKQWREDEIRKGLTWEWLNT